MLGIVVALCYISTAKKTGDSTDYIAPRNPLLFSIWKIEIIKFSA